MTIPSLGKLLPSWKNLLLAVLAAALLILAFPDFEYWFLAWFALVPLMWAVEREKVSAAKSFVLGWAFGTIFFFGTCWWLTYAPIHYAGFPPVLAYFLLFCVTVITGLFPGIFAGILSIFLRRLGSWGFLAAPFVWVFTEFLRYWVTGNNWNAIGYSLSFTDFDSLRQNAQVGGLALVTFSVVVINCSLAWVVVTSRQIQTAKAEGSGVEMAPHGLMFLVFLIYIFPVFGFLTSLVGFLRDPYEFREEMRISRWSVLAAAILVPTCFSFFVWISWIEPRWMVGMFWRRDIVAYVTAVQPNVPMSGLGNSDLSRLRDRQIELTQTAFTDSIEKYSRGDLGLHDDIEDDTHRQLAFEKYAKYPKVVVLPESPMNFAYSDDREFQQFIGDFARRNNVSVLFNSAEPDVGTTKYFNSAVMVGSDGKQVAQYDKLYLLPFGEAVPSFLDGIVPGFVGDFAYGREYDLFPVGDAKAGVVICFESHFGQLSREYVRNGADVIIEMTNDGYLGPTPVLRQHLANAVFRAVETNRPVLRVTNVGITAYINERGEVLNPTMPYEEDTRVWSVAKSDGSQTFYLKYGDWFAWLCSVVTLGLLGYAFFRRRQPSI
jgi:apolipoprotein N-acyltransferase